MASVVEDTGDSPGPGIRIRPTSRDWSFFPRSISFPLSSAVGRPGAVVSSPGGAAPCSVPRARMDSRGGRGPSAGCCWGIPGWSKAAQGDCARG